MSSGRSHTIIILDCQTSGRQPTSASPIEIGWCITPFLAEDQLVSPLVQSSLIALPEEGKWSRGAERITGITRHDMLNAPLREEVWRRLLGDINQASPIFAVIHFARFEKSFLTPLHEAVTGTLGFPIEIACTYEVSRRLFPKLPAFGIRAVSGFLGWELPETRRSLDHVQATHFIWHHLMRKLQSEEQVDTPEKFREWFRTTKTSSRKSSREYLVPREHRLSAPESPGVYRMIARSGACLYVGKATSLKTRVNSYFRKGGTGRTGISEMLAQVNQVDFVPTPTSLEAAIVENDEIKRLDPPYNRMLRIRDRRILFRSTDFTHYEETPSKGFPFGPFTSDFAFDRFDLLCAILEGLELPESFYPVVVSNTRIQQAVQFLSAQIKVPLSAEPTPKQVLSFCWAVAHRTVYSNERLAWDELSETDLTQDVLASQITRLCHRTVRRIRRARWIARLTSCRLEWQPKAGNQAKRFLVLEKGELMERGEATLPVAIRRTRGGRLSTLNELNPERYDRLNVLMAEIRRIISTQKVWLTLSSGIILTEKQLMISLEKNTEAVAEPTGEESEKKSEDLFRDPRIEAE